MSRLDQVGHLREREGRLVGEIDGQRVIVFHRGNRRWTAHEVPPAHPLVYEMEDVGGVGSAQAIIEGLVEVTGVGFIDPTLALKKPAHKIGDAVGKSVIPEALTAEAIAQALPGAYVLMLRIGRRPPSGPIVGQLIERRWPRAGRGFSGRIGARAVLVFRDGPSWAVHARPSLTVVARPRLEAVR